MGGGPRARRRRRGAGAGPRRGPVPVHRRHRPRAAHPPHALPLLERFDFDAVLFPYNHSLLADPGYRADVEALLERCGAHGVAAQTIKAIARRRWPDDATGPRFSWYQPIEDPAAIARAVRYVLADERVFLNTTSDARLLPLDRRRRVGVLDRPSDDELTADEAALDIAPIFDGDTLERI